MGQGRLAGQLRWPREAWAAVRLLRPLNFVLFGAGVVVGGVLSAGLEALQGVLGARLMLAAASAALIGGGANSLHDAVDVAIDRINRPRRPIPAGHATRRTARLLWLFCSAAGVVLSLWLSAWHVGLAVVAVGLLLTCNVVLKHTVLWGNLTVSAVAALALLYGGGAVGPSLPAAVGAVFAFLTTLAREVAKDMEDVSGAAALSAGTLPVVHGAPAAARVVVLVLAVTVALTPMPFLFLGYGSLFLLLVLAAAALLLRAAWLIQTPRPGVRAGQASGTLKGAIVAGMLALAVSGVVG